LRSPRWAEISKNDQKENFFTFFFFVDDFCLPRSGSQLGSGSRSTDPLESESNPDQNLKHCSKLVKHIVGEILIFWNISGIFPAGRGEKDPASQYWEGMGRALDTPQAVIKQEPMSPGPTSTPSETRSGERDLGRPQIYRSVESIWIFWGTQLAYLGENRGFISSSTIPRVRKESRTFSIQDSLVGENLGLSIASCDGWIQTLFAWDPVGKRNGKALQ
jgi:hypothetical protein